MEGCLFLRKRRAEPAKKQKDSSSLYAFMPARMVRFKVKVRTRLDGTIAAKIRAIVLLFWQALPQVSTTPYGIEDWGVII